MAWRIRSTEPSCNNSLFRLEGRRGEISHKSYEGGQTMGPNNSSDNIMRIKFKDPNNLLQGRARTPHVLLIIKKHEVP